MGLPLPPPSLVHLINDIGVLDAVLRIVHVAEDHVQDVQGREREPRHGKLSIKQRRFGQRSLMNVFVHQSLTNLLAFSLISSKIKVI